MSKRVFLDNAATTPMAPEIVNKKEAHDVSNVDCIIQAVLYAVLFTITKFNKIK